MGGNIFALYANYAGAMYSSMYNGSVSAGRVVGSVTRGDGMFIASRTSSISKYLPCSLSRDF
jgi:hypothetical protein